ncbi:hypothetical protein ACFFQW_07980, partial [Umezawaea endophytica]|uniref:hypothetical protein n=1 Tax=Umezawaea endophytica TaxID=1654476 RepID=UPI0035E889FF
SFPHCSDPDQLTDYVTLTRSPLEAKGANPPSKIDHGCVLLGAVGASWFLGQSEEMMGGAVR